MKCPFCIKVCTKCKRILVAYGGNFAKHKTCKYGFRSKCKECDKKYSKEWRENNPEYMKEYNKEWRENNPEYMKQYYNDNSEHIKERHKQWHEDNKEHRKEHVKEYSKQYYKDNSEHVKEYMKQRWDKYLEENGLERGEGSIGEQKVRQILNQSNITFVEQYRFDDCKFKLPLPFDFYIPSLNIAIEYDGIQHFEATGGWSDEEFLKGIQERDSIKEEYCKANNIRLIRIPYWEFDNIESILSDLL